MNTFLPGRSRLLLRLGFGGLLGIIAISGMTAILVLRDIRANSDTLRRQYLERDHALGEIRSEVYLSGTYVRDYLLDPDPTNAAAFAKSLEAVRRDMENALASYRPQTGAADAKERDELRAELSQYWETVAPILRWTPEQRRERGYPFLRDDVFPRRAAMLDVANRIAAINEAQLNEGNRRLAELISTFEMRLMLTVVAALALGLGLAAFTGNRILRLEAQVEERLAEASAARTQLAALSARLVEAQEAERRSLARELHDEVGQSLSAVLIELRNLERSMPRNAGLATGVGTEVIRRLVDGTLKTVRNMSLLLRPSMLDDLGLMPALRWQAREVSKRTDLNVSVTGEVDGEELPEDYKTCIYRVFQEALNNAVRHANCSEVNIAVDRGRDCVTVQIRDDGKGFDPAENRGMGLLGMEERAARLGGTLLIRSRPGDGTTLTLELPLAERSRAPETDTHFVGG